MNPSRRRLSVTKPSLATEATPDSSSDEDGSDARFNAIGGNQKSPKLPSSESSPVKVRKLPATKSRSKGKRFKKNKKVQLPGMGAANFVKENGVLAIQLAEEDDRTFELGDLLTRNWAARNSSFLVSFAIHTFLILIFSLVLITGTGKAIIVLQMLNSADIEEDDGTIAEIEVDLDSADELISPFDDALMNTVMGESDGDQQIVDIGDRAGVEGGGDTRAGAGDGKSAKFFGTKAQGNKFVYVLDRSGSMDYESAEINDYRVTRFDVARMELLKSVESLQPHQEFYVVLFSTGMKQMFNEESLLPKSVKATPENKARLKDWLWEDRASGGTDPRDSLKLAFKMKPDAIFMLSDGEFRDERDGDPLSIDITKRQMQEKTPIRINSIALEDNSSKANMEELSDVSGGQFRFVKVRDYIDKIVESPGNIFFGKNQLVQSGDISNWAKRHEIAIATIPVLQSRSEFDRQKAEERLQALSYGLFDTSIPSVVGPFKSSVTEKAVSQWTDVWTKANDQAVLDASTSEGLFCTLANVGNKNFLDAVESLDANQMEPLHQIATARSILSYQKHGNAVNERSRTLLLEFLDDLNKASKAKFGRDRFIKSATLQTCERRIVKVLRNRRGEASKLLNKTKNRKLSEIDRIVFARKLILLYPETKYAIEVSEAMNLPVSHLDSN